MNRFKWDRMSLSTSRKMLIIAIFDALIAQFYFDSLPFDFKFSISVAILPVYYYFDRSLNPVKTGLHVMVVGLLFRSVTMAARYGGLVNAFMADFPFVYFDILYGVLFYFMFYKSDNRNLPQWAVIAVFADWMGNSVEAIARYGPEFILTSNATVIFLIVALIRVVISITIVVFLNHYSRLIRKDEHEIRYKQLLMLTSDLKSEAYFIQKNMDYIEYVMGDAYTLYSELDELPADDVKRIALKIATDIHEIKKNYSRVVDGLGKITGSETNFDEMKISELLRILKFSFTRYLESSELDIQFVVTGHSNQYIQEHYLLMSILRNLVNNAIEELSNCKHTGLIKLKFLENEEQYIFTVTDNGRGIDQKDLDFIFETGFSTKYNKDTGDICRGVGLALVKEIIENRLNGQIEVFSEKNIGTEFIVAIDKTCVGG